MGEALLVFYAKEWEKFKMGAKVSSGLLKYLNRHYVVPQRDSGHDVSEVGTLFMTTWRDAYFNESKEAVSKAALSLIVRDHHGARVDGHAFSVVLDSFRELDNAVRVPGERSVYEKEFEEPFLEDLRAFLKRDTVEFRQGNPLSEYVGYVVKRMASERALVEKYLNSSTLAKVNEVLGSVLVGEHVDDLLSLTKVSTLFFLHCVFRPGACFMPSQTAESQTEERITFKGLVGECQILCNFP